MGLGGGHSIERCRTFSSSSCIADGPCQRDNLSGITFSTPGMCAATLGCHAMSASSSAISLLMRLGPSPPE
eukprot:2853643-Amphidinium_carterae.1